MGFTLGFMIGVIIGFIAGLLLMFLHNKSNEVIDNIQ